MEGEFLSPCMRYIYAEAEETVDITEKERERFYNKVEYGEAYGRAVASWGNYIYDSCHKEEKVNTPKTYKQMATSTECYKS